MEKMVIVKMARYIELVEQFSKNETDIFTEEEINSTRNNGTLTFSNNGDCFVSVGAAFGAVINGGLVVDGKEIYVDDKGDVKSRDSKKSLTRGEQLKANAMVAVEKRAILMDEWEEFHKLRKQLKDYFGGAKNLINE